MLWIDDPINSCIGKYFNKNLISKIAIEYGLRTKFWNILIIKRIIGYNIYGINSLWNLEIIPSILFLRIVG